MYKSKELMSVTFTEEENQLLRLSSKYNTKKGGIINELRFKEAGFDEKTIAYTVDKFKRFGLIENILYSPNNGIACYISDFGLLVNSTLEKTK
ncbi:MAG: hypothetical protein K0R54_199 [Clostridiaceae bacterium]|jgi:predicted transcriptional regulator|nr:hypothetical protein [Clostridiaceae bacterium]